MSGWNTVDCMTPYDTRLMTPPSKHLQSRIIDALSYIQTQISPRSPCHRQLLLIGTVTFLC